MFKVKDMMTQKNVIVAYFIIEVNFCQMQFGYTIYINIEYPYLFAF